ncbi:MFS transporter [Chloroflexota bacterium]
MLKKRKEAENNLSHYDVRGKLFYGWVTAIAGAVIIFAASNFQYSFGVFVIPLISKFGWSRAAISGSVSTRSIINGIGAPVIGTLSDKYGPKKFIMAGIFLTGLAYLLASRITNLSHLYLSLGILAGIGTGLFATPLIALMAKWFGHKSAFPVGIVTSGWGVGQMIIPPVATYLLFQYGWATCVIILGVVAWVLGSLSLIFIKSPSSNITRTPPQPLVGVVDDGTIQDKTAGDGSYTFLETWHTSAFWSMFLILMITAACYQMVVVHIIPAAIDTGITPEVAAIILTLLGITNTLGRLLLGALASKFGNLIVLVISAAVQAVALLFLAGTHDLQAFYIVAIVYGLTYGGVGPIIPALAGRYFGTRWIGPIIGAIMLAYTTGAAIGPLLAGLIFDVRGSYFIAFSSAATAMFVAFLFCLSLKPPKKKAFTNLSEVEH